MRDTGKNASQKIKRPTASSHPRKPPCTGRPSRIWRKRPKIMKAPAKSRLHFGEVAIATVAGCLRWGSYFAVLANPDLPQLAAAFDPEVSCIGDGAITR